MRSKLPNIKIKIYWTIFSTKNYLYSPCMHKGWYLQSRLRKNYTLSLELGICLRIEEINLINENKTFFFLFER